MKKLILTLITTLACLSNSFASHLMGGDITYTYVGGNNYEITLTVYGDCYGISVSTSQTVHFQSSSCGQNFSYSIPFIQTTEVSQVCPTAVTTCNGGSAPGTEANVFRGIVSLPPCSDWVMSWTKAARNAAITNLVNPSFENIYIENTLNNIIGVNNNSPQYFNLPTPYLCYNNLAIYSHGATDVDGDSLYYSFTQPLSSAGNPIAFAAGYTLLDPMITTSGMNLNQETGEMCFTPAQAQIVVISILIQEYRNGVLIGTQIREMQVVVDNCSNNSNPTTGVTATCGGSGGMTITQQGPTVSQIDNNSIVMCPNDSLCFEISMSDPDADNITVTSNVATAIPTASFTISNNGTTNPSATFCWVPTPLDSGLNVFAIILKDDNCPIIGTQTFIYDITVYDQPYAGPDQTICGDQTAQLQALGGGGYVWSVISGDPMNVGVNFSCDSCDNPVANPAITTTYLLSSSLGAACVNTDTITVFRVPDYDPDITPFDTSVCVFGGTLVPVQLNASPDSVGYTYSWDNSGSLDDPSIANPIASPSSSTDYILTITSPYGCVKTDTATISVTTFPAIAITGDLINCPGETVTLTATAGSGYSYNWYPTGDTIQTIDVDSGKFVVEVNVNGCTGHTDTSEVTIMYMTKPILNDTAFCAGSTVFVTAAGPTSYAYTWDPPVAIGQTAGLTQPGNYAVVAYDAVSGCSIWSDTIEVTEIPAPMPVISGVLAACLGDSTYLSVGGGWNSIQWLPGNSSDTAIYAGVGPITVVVTDPTVSTCQGVAMDTVELLPAAAPDIMGSLFACQGSTTTLSVGSGWNSVEWIPGNSTDTTFDASAGMVIVNVEDPNTNCPGSDTVTVNTSIPQPTIIGVDTICPGESDIVSVSPTFSSYLWSNGDTTISTSASGTVDVTVTDMYGCSETASASIPLNPVPSADFLIDPLPNGQPGIDVTFTDNSSGAISWFWDFGDGVTDSSQNIIHIYDLQGTYPVTLTISNIYGCINSYTEDYLIVSDIVIPNVFTPGNGDGSNDYLVFTNLEYYENHLEVYNRWGNKVFETENYKNDWAADKLNVGTYYFILNVYMPKGDPIIYKGAITILK